MSVFEQLHPFVSLFQACGMIPYTIEQDLATQKFEKFTFSFKHRTTWWFVLNLILQIVSVVTMAFFSNDLGEDLSTDKTMPVTVLILFSVTQMSRFAEILLSRCIALRFRRLRNAVEAVQEVERLFGDKYLAEHSKSSIKERFIIGFILVNVSAIGMLFVSISALESLSLARSNILFIISVLFMLTLINIMIDCTLFLSHLCYHIIAHYIQLLFIHSDLFDDDMLMTSEHINLSKRDGNFKTLRQSAKIFDSLCRASSEINDIFSAPVLFLLTTKFISVVTYAFVYIYSFIHENAVLESGNVAFPFVFITDWSRILVILASADLPVNQVRLLRERMSAVMSRSRFSQKLTDNVEAITLLLQIDEDRVRLTAAGLFKVGMHLIPALTGAVVTYMVILLQN